MTGRRIRALATVTVVLVSAACGQKAGVGGPDEASAPAAGAPSVTVTTAGQQALTTGDTASATASPTT